MFYLLCLDSVLYTLFLFINLCMCVCVCMLMSTLCLDALFLFINLYMCVFAYVFYMWAAAPRHQKRDLDFLELMLQEVIGS